MVESHGPPTPPLPRWRAYLALGRVSNLPTVWTNVLAGVWLATREAPTVGAFAYLALALSLFYVGGMFLNDAFDREIDREQRPERPIPRGVVSPEAVYAAGFGLLVAGLLLLAGRALFTGRWASLAAGLTLAVAVVIYDAWHKQNPLAPVLMGICRMLVYLTAGLAAGPALTPMVAGGALTLFAYVIGLTYVARHERDGALSDPRNLWPLLLLLVPFAAVVPAAPGRPLAAVAAATMLGWIVWAVRTLRGERPDRVPRAVMGLIAGISLVDAVLLAATGAPAGLVLAAAAGVAVTLGGQRYVRGT